MSDSRDLLRDLLPTLEERDGIRAAHRLLARALVDSQNKIDELMAQQAQLLAAFQALASKEAVAPQVNVPPSEVIVSPYLQSAPGSSWTVRGKDGNGRPFSFTVTKD